MTRRELDLLGPWLEAGVGVPAAGEPDPLLVRKRYLTDNEDGTYTLTERGAEQAARARVNRLRS